MFYLEDANNCDGTESSSVLSEDSSNSNNGGYYINHNNAIFYVADNGTNLNLASTFNNRNIIRENSIDSSNINSAIYNNTTGNQNCYLLKSNQLNMNDSISVNNGNNNISTLNINPNHSAVNSTFTELQPASTMFNQLSSIESLNTGLTSNSNKGD